VELLQSSALPLGYVAEMHSGWRESNPRVDLGKVTGYHYITPAHRATPSVLALSRRVLQSPAGAPGCGAESARVVWIYALPVWVFAPICVIIACTAAALLLAFVRDRFIRSKEITHNDVAGPILGTIGTVLAVMMSFMVVGVWQEYDSSAANVQVEAGTLSDLHHLADAFSQPVRNRLKAEVDKYITNVVTVEWPLMRTGGESLTAHYEADDIAATIMRITPSTQAQSNVQQTALELAERFLDARRTRMHDNRQGIPMDLWGTMIFIGALTIGFSFYFRVDRPRAQYLMVLSLTAVITVTFTLIAELDFPFRGDIAITPDAFTHTFQVMHNIGLAP
jgi:Protein of unknown function (DUF4239)